MVPNRRLIRKDKGKTLYYECSNCGWMFEFAVQIDPPTGQPEEQQRKIFEAQRDQQFQKHDCAKYPKPRGKSN